VIVPVVVIVPGVEVRLIKRLGAVDIDVTVAIPIDPRMESTIPLTLKFLVTLSSLVSDAIM
jgi:hypothetical protein